MPLNFLIVWLVGLLSIGILGEVLYIVYKSGTNENLWGCLTCWAVAQWFSGLLPFKHRLSQSLRQTKAGDRGVSAEEVAKKLGLNW